MKIAIFGASGMIGRRILAEALARGHTVTALSREPDRLDLQHAGLSKAIANALVASEIAEAVRGHDVVVSAFGPGKSQLPHSIYAAARAMLDGVTRAGIKRLLVIGGAGSLELSPGVPLIESPELPASLKEIARAHADALELYRSEGNLLDWTYVSPPAQIAPGQRTATFRVGSDRLLMDARGVSRISAEDLGVAVIDELETPLHVRRRFTVAY